MSAVFDRLELSRLADIDTWIFDLDNTLYDADADFFKQIDVKMTAFIANYLGVDAVQAKAKQKQYLVEYGTSLSGMMAVHKMDPADFLQDVHDVDLSMLTPNPNLRARIKALPGRKFIYPNGSRQHARNVASHLNLFDLFHGSFGVEDAAYVPKPQRETYEVFNRRFDVDPKRAIFFEDNVRNLNVPYQMGMATVLVGSDADFSHEPQEVRPARFDLAGRLDEAVAPEYVDVVTKDLAGWLGAALKGL